MAEKINVISIAFVLMWMVCITTQKTWRQARCDKAVKNIKRRCEYECSSTKIPVDGVWEEWIETSTCTVTCGGGTKSYSRKCIEPQHGGKACEGDASKKESCGEEECPGTLKQCDTFPVVRNVMIPWNPDSESITVSTDSVEGSDETVAVRFHDKDGNWAGSVFIYFKTQMMYSIGWCTFRTGTPFPVTLPTETQKTWMITYNYTEQRIVFYCNGVQVLNVVVSDSVCTRWSTTNSWRDWWKRKPAQIRFSSDSDTKYSFDTASDSFCLSSKPGAV